MRRSAKVDANQAEIVKALRQIGCSVVSIATVGGGCPDLVVAVNPATNILLEVKDGDKVPSQRKLNPDQVKFHREWKGPIHVVEDKEQAIALVQLYRNAVN